MDPFLKDDQQFLNFLINETYETKESSGYHLLDADQMNLSKIDAHVFDLKLSVSVFLKAHFLRLKVHNEIIDLPLNLDFLNRAETYLTHDDQFALVLENEDFLVPIFKGEFKKFVFVFGKGFCFLTCYKNQNDTRFEENFLVPLKQAA